MTKAKLKVLEQRFSDWRWRLNNLYYIIDKDGKRIRFEMNGSQERFFNDMHYLNVILKARQLGFTTFIQIFMLDAVVFNADIRAGTIAHNLDDAKVIFRDKVKYPYDNLPDALKRAIPAKSDTAMELLLGNNSSIRVGTSHRSGTLQYLHISEYGKVCAKFPEKAREVRTGALNTVQAGNIVFIESTAEGQEGDFYDICQAAESRERLGTQLTPLDYKFHFFPWWKSPEYALDDPHVLIPHKQQEYFDKLAEHESILLSEAQKVWYVKKLASQKEDMKREYPSTSTEAFEASIEGAYYGEQMALAEEEGRVGEYKAEDGYPVYTAWDIGYGDDTAIWFFQALQAELRLVGFTQNHGKFLEYYDERIKQLARDNGWTLGSAYVPHDIRVHEWASGKIRIDEMIRRGLKPVLIPDVSIEDGRNAVRNHLGICKFDQAGCDAGIQHLKLYRKDWDDKLGTWKESHRKDGHVHGADAFRYLVLGYQEFKPAGPLPDYDLDPAGKPIVPMDTPKVLSELTYGEFHKINAAYERSTKI